VAVRHADDHTHIAATLVRQDGRRAKLDYDIRAVQREARQIEIDYGLRRLKQSDGSAAKRPTGKPHFKAQRLGQDSTSREILRLRVRRAMAAASTGAEFFALLDATGVKVRPKTGPSGDVSGYSVSLPGDVNKQKHQATAATERISLLHSNYYAYRGWWSAVSVSVSVSERVS